MKLDELRNRLNAASAIPELFQRQLFVAAIITSAVESSGVRPVVVGGCAVELYTFGSFASYDIDLVAPAHTQISHALDELGFLREGRHWYHPDIDVAVEIPDSALAGDPERITRVEVDDLQAFFIGIEDLILDRARAAVHWKSSLDEETVRNLLAAHAEEIDWDYLEKEADKDGPVADFLGRVRQ